MCHCYHVTSTKSSYSKSYAILFVNWWFSLKHCSRVTLLHCDQQAELTYRWQRSPWSQKSKAAKSRLVLARTNCLPNNHQGLGSLLCYVNVLERRVNDAQISLWQGPYKRNPNPIHVSLCASDLKSCSQSFSFIVSQWPLSLEGALFRNTAGALLSPCFISLQVSCVLICKVTKLQFKPQANGVFFSVFLARTQVIFLFMYP